jgi:hypothetical protein
VLLCSLNRTDMTRFSRRLPYSCALIPLVTLLAACGADGPTGLKLQATTSTVMQGGSAIAVNATGGRKGDKVSWRLLPGSAGTLTASSDTRSAIYFPGATGSSGTLSIEATLRSDKEVLALQVQPSPVSELVASLPQWWQPVTVSGNSGITGEPRGFAPDGAGGYYVSYAAPTSKVVQVKAGGAPVEIGALAGYGIIGGTKDGTLYLVQDGASNALTVSKRAPDGKLTVLTRTAAHDGKKATIDGPSGTATALRTRFAFDGSGNLYALDGSKVRKIAADGSWSTLAGDGCGMGDAPACAAFPVAGKGSGARIGQGAAIAAGTEGTLYVASAGSILKVTSAGDVTILAGATSERSDARMIDGAGADAYFHQPLSLSLDTAGNIYALDYDTIRRITPAGAVSTVATGIGMQQQGQPELSATRIRMNDDGTLAYLRAVDLRRVKVQ